MSFIKIIIGILTLASLCCLGWYIIYPKWLGNRVDRNDSERIMVYMTQMMIKEIPKLKAYNELTTEELKIFEKKFSGCAYLSLIMIKSELNLEDLTLDEKGKAFQAKIRQNYKSYTEDLDRCILDGLPNHIASVYKKGF